ncbi:MAG: hypothetical protein WCR51_06115 [Planctomycetia bacterium]
MTDLFDTLAAEAARGPADLFATLAASLVERRRWHALFDLRLLEARAALGLPLTGDLGALDPALRDALDERSLAACREVGWPLLEEGSVAAAWMYLRAAAEPAAVAAKLRDLATRLPADDEAAEARRAEILHVGLWEGLDPALGLELVLEAQGTCNAITAYEQGVSRLPAARQQEAAAVLVTHLYREVATNLASDLERRGLIEANSMTTSIAALLAAAGGLADDPSVHVDVSHLQSVLRIARVATNRDLIEQAWELALYACRLPAEATYPGEPPFENVGEASRLFYAAQLGRDADAAVRFFRAAATTARLEEAGTLPADILALLLWRLGRPAEALHAMLERPADGGMPSVVQASGMLPSLVEMAAAGDALDVLRRACRDRGDEITFAATYVVSR